MDDNRTGPVILVWVSVPDIDLVAVAQGDIFRVLASNEHARIDRCVGLEF